MPNSKVAEIAARLDRLPASATIWKMIALISLGGLFEFYDLFFTGYVVPGMKESGIFAPESLGVFAELEVLKLAGPGTFVFATFAGLWIGTLVFGFVADRLGRRTIFTWSLIWYMVCTAIMAFQETGFAIDIWRLIAGIGIGVELVTIDTYISELVPKTVRGRAYAVNQVITFSAVPLVAFLAWMLKGVDHPFGLDYWRVVMLIGSVGAIVVWVLRRGIPESPRWLAENGHLDEAERVTAQIEEKVRAETGAKDLPAPHPEHMEVSGARASLAEIFSPLYAKRTLILSIFNMAQVIGFYGFASWVPTLLIHRGITVTTSLQYAFIIAIANPFGPLLGTWFADKLERKTQIVGGLATMAVVIFLFAQANDVSLLIALGVLFTLASNIMSYGFHGYQAELYPTRVRARAVGFVYSWSRISAAFAGLIIAHLLQTQLGVTAVAIFIAAAMVIAIIMILLGPATKGMALEAINK